MTPSLKPVGKPPATTQTTLRETRESLVRQSTLCRRKSLTRLQSLTTIRPLHGSSLSSSFLVSLLRLRATSAASVLSRALQNRLGLSSGSAWRQAYPCCGWSCGGSTQVFISPLYLNLCSPVTATHPF